MKSIFGFTLVELLIVITIISILLTTGLVGYNVQIQKSYDSIRKRDLNNIKIAFESYLSDHGCYPPATILNNCNGTNLQPYMPKIPCDPTSGSPYSLKTNDNTCAQKFHVYVALGNKNDPQIYCNGLYVVYSTTTTELDLGPTCGQTYCQSGYYGCVNGACVLISGISKPSCSPLFCVSNCQNSCSVPGFELQPQPCNP